MNIQGRGWTDPELEQTLIDIMVEYLTLKALPPSRYGPGSLPQPRDRRRPPVRSRRRRT